MSEDHEDTCPICAASISDDIAKTSCCHTFHGRCLSRYVLQKMLDYEDDVTCPVCRETIAYLRSPTVVINVNNTSEENHGIGMVSLIWALFVGAALIAWLMTTMLDIADRISQRNRDLHPVMHFPFPFLHKNVTLV